MESDCRTSATPQSGVVAFIICGRVEDRTASSVTLHDVVWEIATAVPVSLAATAFLLLTKDFVPSTPAIDLYDVASQKVVAGVPITLPGMQKAEERQMTLHLGRVPIDHRGEYQLRLRDGDSVAAIFPLRVVPPVHCG